MTSITTLLNVLIEGVMSGVLYRYSSEDNATYCFAFSTAVALVTKLYAAKHRAIHRRL